MIYNPCPTLIKGKVTQNKKEGDAEEKGRRCKGKTLKAMEVILEQFNQVRKVFLGLFFSFIVE